MRARRAGLAALLAACAYVFSIAAAPLLFSAGDPAPTSASARVGEISVAHADAASDACASYSGNKSACAAGYNLAAAAPSGQSAQTACATKPSAQQAACEDGFGLAPSSAAASTSSGAATGANGVSVDPDGSTGINVNQCDASAGSLGWMSCPLFDRITHFMSGAAKDLMQQFLAVQPLSLSGPLYQSWGAMRTLANIMFVIIFLVMIFAHVLQYELDAYSIKKMIPKIVAAVVLVQFSYVICSGLVDLGNILGAGIGSIIGSVTGGGNAQAQGFGSVVGSLISDVTSGLAVTALVALAVVNWALAGSVFVILLIAAIGFIVTLAVRYFLIGLLIVLSPLAFAMWVLPNTEAYFSKWLSTFAKLVLMYPIIMLLLSVAGDVGGLLPVAASGNGVAGTVTASLGSTVIKILAVVAAFGAVPQTFKWAGGAMALATDGITKATKGVAKGKWNSSGTQVKRNIAARKRLEVADRIDKGIHGDKDNGYSWANTIGKNRMFGEKLQGLHGPLTNLIAAGAPSDQTDRDFKLGTMVADQAKSLSQFNAAGNPDNLLNVAQWYYAGERAKQAQRAGNTQLANDLLLGKLGTDGKRHGGQAQYAEALKAEGALNLTDFTKSDVRREALFRQMAEKDYLKMPLLNEVHKAASGGGSEGRNALRDHAAMMRQGANKHAGTEPMLFKRRSDSDHLDRIRRDDVLSTIRGLNATAIKSTFSNRNFETAAGVNTNDQTAQDAASIFAEGLDAEALRQNFETGGRDFMAADKRTAVLRMMLKHRAEFADDKRGGQIRSAVVKQMTDDIGRDASSHLQVRQEVRQVIIDDAAARGVNAQQALDDAQRWLGPGFTWP